MPIDEGLLDPFGMVCVVLLDVCRGCWKASAPVPGRIGVKEARQHVTRPNPCVVDQHDPTLTQPIRQIEPVHERRGKSVPAVDERELVRRRSQAWQRVLGSIDDEGHRVELDARRGAVLTDPPNHHAIWYDAGEPPGSMLSKP